MDGAENVSLAKVILDCDVVGMIKRFVREGTVDPSTALSADIAEVGIGGHYLGRRSSREHFRAGEIWQPRVLQRKPFEAYEGRSLVSDAADLACDVLSAHQVPPLADDVKREIDGVIERYARSVGAPGSRAPWRDGL